jgi:hypothetical protein
VGFLSLSLRRPGGATRSTAGTRRRRFKAPFLPLLTTWAHVKPFAGVVLAGLWTNGSLDQLRSNGFSILHIPYETIIEVFRQWDIEVYYEENTEDWILQNQIDRWDALGVDEREELGDALRDAISNRLKVFMDDLSKTVLRRIECVSVLPLHGRITDCQTVDKAIELIESYDPGADAGPVVRFEVIIRYDNGDRITADFGSPADAIAFLDSFRSQ